MKIVLIGTGNTATILGRKLKAAGHDILQVYGRDTSAASDLAYELDTESTNYWNIVSRHADIYIIAVSDIAIAEVLKELQLPQKTMVHTAAAVPKDILKQSTDRYGVFYPLQSLRKDSHFLPDTPIVIDASDENTLRELEALAQSISHRIVGADDEQRVKLHLAAVFCNNFVNHLYALAADFCEKEGIDFSLLHPLIEETAQRLQEMPPSQSQTGPALRNDITTIEKHKAMLKQHPQLYRVYDVLTDSIRQNT